MPTRQTARGYIEPLFDLSFTQFITTKVVKLVYVLTIGLAALGVLLLFVATVNDSFLLALGMLAVTLPFAALFVIASRMWLEAVVVFFRIADNTAELAEQGAAIAMNTARSQPGAAGDVPDDTTR